MPQHGFVDDTYLPISKLNTVVFCPRRYFIESVLGDEERNIHLIEGDTLHARTRREGENIWVWSDRICGIVDQMIQEAGQTVPVEFKKGWLGEHVSDWVQLGAEVLCLREMGRTQASYGYLYYHTTRRRQRIELDDELTCSIETAVAEMRRIAGADSYPPVTEKPSKCRGCSVREACQPTLWRK